MITTIRGGSATDYPHRFLAVCLLDDCNKRCRHCYRTAIPSDHEFKLKKESVLLSLEDASSLKTACFFAGGEPTIWKDGDTDLLSLLIQAANRCGYTAFLSNGYVFEDKDYAYKFVQQYTEECDMFLGMVFSVDFIHENYDSRKRRIPFLDNLLAARRSLPEGEKISFTLISHWTNDRERNIPSPVLEEYAKQGVEWEINDFMMWGRAKEIKDLACYLKVDSSDKRSLGPYRHILAEEMIASGKIQDEDEFKELPNRELLKMISVCGHPPNFFISWGNRYYYCVPQMGHDWFSISKIGKLDQASMEVFFIARPILKEIQNTSIFGILDRYRDMIKDTILKQIESMQESIRFAGCSVCLKLSQEGILQNINQKILDGS